MAEMTDIYRCCECGHKRHIRQLSLNARCECGHNQWEMDLPEEAEPICDFCSSGPVVAKYPARDFQTPIAGSAIGWASHSYWAACEPCHLMIQRHDRVGLCLRSADVYINRHPEHEGKKVKLAGEIRMMHDKFWSHREGDPTMIGEED